MGHGRGRKELEDGMEIERKEEKGEDEEDDEEDEEEEEEEGREKLTFQQFEKQNN